MAWAQSTKTEGATAPAGVTYGADYYRDLFEQKREAHTPIRMALVGK